MPELPEVEDAVRRLRGWIVGRTIVRVRPLHRVLRARLSPRTLRSLRGAVVTRVERRGKHQLIHLDDGRVIHVHFRMAGDWCTIEEPEPPRSARLLLDLDDGIRVALVDPRALGTVDVHPAGAPLAIDIGPEATDPSIDPEWILSRFATRRSAIKPVLLDQRILAGVGNIYAAEALWHAKLDPRRSAASLTRRDVVRLLRAIRTTLKRASGERYFAGGGRFAVYGREGDPCPQCRSPIARIAQAGRSTYYCPRCQGAPGSARAAGAPRAVSRAPRRARP